MNEVSGFFARYCDRCIHSHLDPARGVVCGLTRQRPDTSRPCGDLVIDVEREEDVLWRQRLARRAEQYRNLDTENAELDPYPDPQGAGAPRGWQAVVVYGLTALLALVLGSVAILQWFL